jgi:hypothetical protein
MIEATEPQSWKDEHRFAHGYVETCKYSVHGQNAAPKVIEGGTYSYRYALKS